MGSHARAEHPFALAISTADGRSRIDLARAVIDASGTWSSPNPASASGTPAIGEVAAADRIAYGIPDVLRRDRAVYAGCRVLVVGGGHSAANVLLDLARLAETDTRLQISWAVRGANLARIFGGGAQDKLPARGKLGDDLKRLVDSGRLMLALSFAVEAIASRGDGLLVSERASQSRILGPFDRIVVCTGQRPDLSLTRELRLDLDPWLESARTLGPMIDPNLHSCGSVPPHGYRELSHPEPDYFAVGVKSYGRAPTFLMATGYEQVRSVAAHLAGDETAARDVRLVLPETGVCSSDLAPSIAANEGCCGGPAPIESDACCVADAAAKANGERAAGARRRRPPRLSRNPAAKAGAMADPIYNVLFLCTGNSARSVLAEAILSKIGAGKFRAYSAGSQPKGQVNPNTIHLLQKLGYDTASFRSKSWSEFAQPGAPGLDFVFTVCDDAAGEACPVWPGQPMTAHWGIPDPAAAVGSPAEIALAFGDAYRMLHRRIEVFAALPISALDSLTLQGKLRDIARMAGATAKEKA